MTRVALRLAVPVGVLALWQVLAWTVGEPAIVAPAAVLQTLWSSLGEWGPDIAVTAQGLALAFVISAVAGVLLGFAIGMSPSAWRVVSPLALSLYSLPKIVLYPIVLLIFGLTLRSRVVFGVLHGFFPILLLTAMGTATIAQVHLKLARMHRLSFLARVRTVMFPSVLPSVVSALRIGLGATFLGLVLAEMFAAYDGLGFRLVTYASTADTERLLAVVTLLVLAAVALTYPLYRWEARWAKRLGGGDVA